MAMSLVNQERQMKTPMSHGPTRKRTCQVVGCKSDLSSNRYCWKRRCCAAHLRARAVTVSGMTGMARFCQQCGKFEALSSFLGDRRSCTAALEKRRRLEHAKHTGSPSSSTLSLSPSTRRSNAGHTAPLSATPTGDTRSDSDDGPQLPSTPDCCASGQQRDSLQPRSLQQQQSPGQQALPAAPSASADDTLTAAVMDRDQQLREMVALAEDDEAEAIDMELELLLHQAMREAAAHSAAAPAPAAKAAPPVAGASAVLLPAEASPAAAILPAMGPPAARTATHKQQQRQGGGRTMGHPADGWVARTPGAFEPQQPGWSQPAAAPRPDPEAFEARLAWLQKEYVQLQAHLTELHATLCLLMQS